MPGKRKVFVFLTRLFFSVLRVLNVTVQSIARKEWLIFVKNKFYLSIFFNFTQVSVLEKTNRLNFLALSLKKENVSCTFHIETTVLIFVLYILIIFEIIWLYFCQEVANFAPFNIKKLVLKTFLFFLWLTIHLVEYHICIIYKTENGVGFCVVFNFWYEPLICWCKIMELFAQKRQLH